MKTYEVTAIGSKWGLSVSNLPRRICAGDILRVVTKYEGPTDYLVVQNEGSCVDTCDLWDDFNNRCSLYVDNTATRPCYGIWEYGGRFKRTDKLLEEL